MIGNAIFSHPPSTDNVAEEEMKKEPFVDIITVITDIPESEPKPAADIEQSFVHSSIYKEKVSKTGDMKGWRCCS